MRSNKKFTITKGIFYSFAAIISLFAVHGFFSFTAVRQLAGLARTIHDHPLVVSNASLRANTNIIKMHRSMKDVVLFDDPAVTSSAIKEVNNLEAETFIQLREVEENILGREGQKLAAEAVRLFREWKPIRDQVIRLARNGDRKNAALITKGIGAAHVAKLEVRMIALNAYARNKGVGFLVETEAGYVQAKRRTLFLIILFVVLCSGIAFFTLKRTRFLESKLAEEKMRLATTFRSIGDGVVATDKTGLVTMLNQVAEELTGWPEDEAVGHDIGDIFNIVNEKTGEPCSNPVEKILETGAIVGLANHTVLIAKDGSKRAIADSGAPIRNTKGEIVGTIMVFRDQTEEREYQNRIVASEKKYRLLSDNTLDLIWAMNTDLEFTYVNRAITDLTGYSPEEWIGSRLSEHLSRENLAMVSLVIEKELAKGPESKGTSVETFLLDRNRKAVPVEVHGKLISDGSGRPLGFQGTARDISERKRAEAELRHQSRLLREMGHMAKIGAWEFDPDTGKGSWTDEVARIHDLEPDAETDFELGMSFYRGAAKEKIEAAIKEAIESAKPYDLELELITAKGAHKWVRTIGMPVTEDGVVKRVRGSFQDITEQKRNELRISHLNLVLRAIREVNQLIVRERDQQALISDGCRLLVENRGYASAQIILTDENGRPSSWGRAGIAATSEEHNKRLEHGVLPPCCDQAGGKIKVIPAANRGDICGDCPIAEDCRTIHSFCMPLVHEGELFGYLIVALEHDLTIDEEEKDILEEISDDLTYSLKTIRMDKAREESERKSESLEHQLLHAQKMESVGRLAGGVAHDYNNMLGVIIGNAELALEKISPEDPLHGDLEEILKAAKRSTSITRQLLAFARRQTVAPKLIDLNETVDSQLKMLRRLLGEDIDFAWLPDLGLGAVKIDPVQVDQILTNLCVNARDAISGVGKVTIETANVTFDREYCNDHVGFIPGDYVMLAVSDNGSGMDQETMEKIFEPFFTTKEVGRGTGLGLATVYGIVKQNFGFINLYSELGKGTTFRIYLPRHMGEIVVTRDKIPEEVQVGRGETILLVEDEVDLLNLGKRVLEGLGYAVLDAATPAEAIEMARQHGNGIGLLITDVVMPDMNGRDLADKLVELCPDLKVIFMSGYTANTIAHQGVLDEGVNFIQKPFTKVELGRKIREVLDIKNLSVIPGDN